MPTLLPGQNRTLHIHTLEVKEGREVETTAEDLLEEDHHSPIGLMEAIHEAAHVQEAAVDEEDERCLHSIHHSSSTRTL